MVSWSSLGRNFGINLVKNFNKTPLILQNVKLSTSNKLKSDHGHRTFDVQPSRWQYHKFKDMLHYYAMVGLIPVGLIIFYCNVFIGPATLTEIPPDYEPKHWEYHRHPITRFIARYIYNNPKQDYEKFLHFLLEEKERMQIRKLESQIKAKMEEREDYQAYYYKPVLNRYLRETREVAEAVENRLGDDYEE